ncbi:hypothetical protein BJ138DRAFT_945507 [Hygrophoropsis aurantiaca]|uniref:Uncharacterized protein n=1 Tax=Hygrophoropsis aurantiaca TaxID=72124 RepID=A0ACB8AEH7_9AGAM|nr:hypothetical protein BJ138DRAFT_945507 [Hygrophoropsis aurantiaca]
MTIVRSENLPRNPCDGSESGELNAPSSRSVQQVPRVAFTSVKRKIEEVDRRSDGNTDSDPEMDEDCDVMDVDIAEVNFKVPVTVKTERQVRTTPPSAEPLPKKVKIDHNESQAVENATPADRRPPRTNPRNQDLPVSASDPRWLQGFMNTVILWAGSQRGWKIPKSTLVKVLQKIFDAVFPEINYKVTLKGPVLKLATQHLSKWRSNIGSTALAMMIHFCSHTREEADPDESPKPECKDIAREFLKKLKFLYKDSENPSKGTAFQSPFILYMIASTHLNAILHYVDIPELKTKELALGDGMGQGVILLVVLALERALTFIRDKIINVEEILDQIAAGSKIDFRLPKISKPGRGENIKRSHQFNERNWSKETAQYMISLNRRNRADIRAIVAAASPLSRADDSEMEVDE